MKWFFVDLAKKDLFECEYKVQIKSDTIRNINSPQINFVLNETRFQMRTFPIMSVSFLKAQRTEPN